MTVRRKLALLGLFFLLCQLAAALMSPVACLALAAGCFAAFFLACLPARRFSLCCIFLCAAALVAGQQLYLQTITLPALRLELGGGRSLLVRVEETWASYEEDRVGARVTVLEADGEPCEFSAYCAAFPWSEPGELVRGVFQVTELPRDEYRLAHMADGMRLALEYVDDVSWEGRADTLLLRIAAWRLELARRIRRYIDFDEGSVLCAMTLGESTGLSEELEQLFRQAGVSHLLVVSGLHLTLVCGLLTAPMPNQRVRALLALLILPGFVLITGLSPSVLRAGVALAISSVGLAAGLPVDPFTSLGVAALVLGLLNPYAACDLGLQLSFCATLGVLCAGAVCSRLSRYRYPTPWPVRLLGLVLPSVLAAGFSLPVLLLQGLAISGVSVLSNLLVLYLAPAILMGGLASAACALSAQTVWLLRPVSALAAFFVRCLLTVLRFTAGLPFARLVLPVGYTLAVWLVLLGLALLFWHSRHYWRWCLAVVPLCAAFALLAGLWLASGLVHIALLGVSSSPCVVAWQGEEAVLVFQGGANAMNEVRDYLEARRLELRYVVDLRRDTAAKPLNGVDCPVVAVRDIPVSMQTSRQISAILVESCPAREGNLARLSVGGFSVVVCSGTVRFAQPLQADVWLLGSYGLDSDIQADCLISSGSLAGGEILYGDGDVLEIRPGRSVRRIEVQYVDE